VRGRGEGRNPKKGETIRKPKKKGKDRKTSTNQVETPENYTSRSPRGRNRPETAKKRQKDELRGQTVND